MSENVGKKPAINPWIIAFVAGMAAFMEILDIYIANVALQYIAGGLSSSNDEATWVLTSYLITNAVILLTSGWFANVIGRKYYFMGCIAGFSITSFLCGIAPSLALLIVFRGLQGLVGGGLQPTAQAILADAFPSEKRGMAFAIYGLAVVFAPAIGPWLGGWLTDNFSWRWVFLINVPIGIILTFLTARVISNPPDEERERQRKRGTRFDGIGFALLSIGMCSLQIVLDRGQIDDWFGSGLITSLAITCFLALTLFIVRELTAREPIVEFSLLKNPNFAIGTALMFMTGFVQVGTTVLFPEYGQEILGYTATDAGLILSPGGFFLVALMPVIGFLLSRIDARLLIGFGILVCCASLVYMTNFYQEIDFWTLAMTRLWQTGGTAFLFIAVNTVAFHGVPKEKSNTASSIVNMARNLGGSIGISVMTTMLDRRAQVHQSMLVRHVTPGTFNYQNAIAHLGQYLLSRWGSSIDAVHQGQAVIYRGLQQQARILAYIDDFEILTIAFLILLPFLFIMKRPEPGSQSPAAH